MKADTDYFKALGSVLQAAGEVGKGLERAVNGIGKGFEHLGQEAGEGTESAAKL